jgi:hypothetical protein
MQSKRINIRTNGVNIVVVAKVFLFEGRGRRKGNSIDFFFITPAKDSRRRKKNNQRNRKVLKERK